MVGIWFFEHPISGCPSWGFSEDLFSASNKGSNRLKRAFNRGDTVDGSEIRRENHRKDVENPVKMGFKLPTWMSQEVTVVNG